MNKTNDMPKTFEIFARFDGHITVDTKAFMEDPDAEVARAIQEGLVKIDAKNGYVPSVTNYDKQGNKLTVKDEIDFEF